MNFIVAHSIVIVGSELNGSKEKYQVVLLEVYKADLFFIPVVL